LLGLSIKKYSENTPLNLPIDAKQFQKLAKSFLAISSSPLPKIIPKPPKKTPITIIILITGMNPSCMINCLRSTQNEERITHKIAKLIRYQSLNLGHEGEMHLNILFLGSQNSGRG